MWRIMHSLVASSTFLTAVASCQPATPPQGPAAAHRQFWAISVRALETADWYVRNFGMKVTHEINPTDGSRVKILENDDAMIEMKPRPATASVEATNESATHDGYFKVGWFVPSLDTEFERLSRNGVTFSQKPIEEKQFAIRFFIVLDAEGNPVQIFERN